MVKAILQVEATISVGKRLGVLIVVVQAPLNPNTVDTIQKLLKTYDVHVYDIFPVMGIAELHRTCYVGSKISNEGLFGTLGGFAERIADKQKYFLLPRHVVQNVVLSSNAVYMAGEKVHISSDHVYICADPSIDVAACLITRDISDKFHFDGRFMTETGNYKPCRVPGDHDFETINYIDGAEVYIRGASTDLGKGKIVSVGMFDTTMSCSIIIEDLEPDQPFCRAGDSGSIVCYNDPEASHIHAIGMLTGLLHSCSNSDVHAYLALDLRVALENLSLNLGGISLFDKEFVQS